jgi:hypothetical protein
MTKGVGQVFKKTFTKWMFLFDALLRRVGAGLVTKT